MMHWIWTIPFLPFAGFLILSLAGRHLHEKIVAVIANLATWIPAVIAFLMFIRFLQVPASGSTYNYNLFTWIPVENLGAEISIHVDSLTLIFLLVITFVGSLIHLYSVGFMKGEEGYARFFAYMNLFVGSMVMLVLAGNLLFLYLAWEAVGLCSYLLIGFWYREASNGHAAMEAFIVTRIGDTLLAIGLFMMIRNFGTLDIGTVVGKMHASYMAGDKFPLVVALMILGGAVGKSAQLPLHVWLPKAMAGPSPVSALIHAATMVTAGVYLIARLHGIFELAPLAMHLTATIGAITLLLAAFSALTQKDIKRVLAWSTISQIGYMFMALGVGAWSAAIFHFFTHAFFKALLFLGAGAVIISVNHEHDMFKMGGLRKKMPITFFTFLAGAASLAALPLVTAGFYSKDAILYRTWESSSPWLYLAGSAGAFLTALYTFRMVFLTFYTEEKTTPRPSARRVITIPLVVLAILSIVSGFINIPENFGNFHLFKNFMAGTLPVTETETISHAKELYSQLISSVLVIAGIITAWFVYLKKPDLGSKLQDSKAGYVWQKGFGIDDLYRFLFVNPAVKIANVNRDDFIDFFIRMIEKGALALHLLAQQTQNGKLRYYAMGIAVGVIIALSLMVMLY